MSRSQRPPHEDEDHLEPPFPLTVACVDAGSNAIRFLVARFSERDRFVPVVSERAAVRLGHDVFLSGRLSADLMDAAVEALVGFRRQMDAQGVEHYRAVATSAVRESSNGNELVRRVLEMADIRLETITGSEEARLVHFAVANRIPMGKEPWVSVDLGGGSVEVCLVDGTGILWSESHTMGSVRLLEELAGSDRKPGHFRRMLSEYVGRLKFPPAVLEQRLAGMVATGGNIETLASLAAADQDTRKVSVLPLADLRRIIETLSRLSYKQRVRDLNLREDRADVILPAAMVYERLAMETGVDRIHVPNVGVKEGVVLDLVDSLTRHASHEEQVEREITAAAVNLGRRYYFDEAHAVHVAALARQLFEQLRDVHKLGSKHRRILVASALLHDIGSYISNKKHHRHSQYLIEHSEIAGLSPAEIQLVATVARYHRKSDPAPGHEPFARLDARNQSRVERLASLLRIADALDHEHRQAVQGVRAYVRGDEVVLEPEVNGDMLLERWSFRKRAQLFQRVFGMTARVKAPRGATS